MAGPYYVSSVNGNDTTGDGTSTTPWATIGKVLSSVTLAANEIVYCHGSMSGQLTMTSALKGTVSTGFIRFIGVANPSGTTYTNNGTKFTINGPSDNTSCLLLNDNDYMWFENFRFTGATGGSTAHGAEAVTSTSSPLVFVNCVADNNTGNGWSMSTVGAAYLFLCYAHTNTLDGFRAGVANYYLFCTAHGNSGDGFDQSDVGQHVMYGCLSFRNSGMGVNGTRALIIQCVIDDHETTNQRGINLSTTQTTTILLGNRITNNNGTGCAGVDGNTRTLVGGWNYFADNTAHRADDSLYYAINDSGNATDVDDSSPPTNEGYTNNTDTETTPDFDLTSAADDTADLRRKGITLYPTRTV